MHGDEAQVLAFVKDRIQADVKQNAARKGRDRADLHNLQLYRGGEDNHWSVWDGQTDSLVPRPTDENNDAALPPWFMRSTLNLFATKIDGICSILNQSRPAQEVGPERDTDKDRAAADIAEAALPQLFEEVDYESLRPKIHKLITLTNTAALHLYFDTDEKHGMEDLPLLQCSTCQQFYLPHEVPPDSDACPDENCPGQVVEAMHPPMSPQAGFPVTASMPRGKMCSRLLNAFEVSVPRSARELHESRLPWIASHGRMAPSEILGLWGDAAKAYLDDQEQRARTSTGSAYSVQFADRLQGMKSPLSAGTSRAGDGTATAQPAGPVVWMVWSDPVDDGTFYFPEGLYAVLLDDAVVVDKGPLPFKDSKGRPFKNVLLRTFQSTPDGGGKPPADDMAPIQKQLNLTLSLAFLILMHDAAPTTFIPDTVTLLDEMTGAPGATVRYTSLRPGDKPVINNGSGFPESLKWFIEFLVNQMDVSSKLNAVLTGARPEGGDPTAFEVQVLEERGMAAFKEPLSELVDFEKRLSLMLLSIARQCAWAPRFYTVAGDNGEWKTEQFLGTDLDGDVTIHVEPSTAWPVSQVFQNMRLDQALERQVLNPADPEVVAEYLSMNDLTRFKKSVDEDRGQVARQIAQWEAAQAPQEIQPPDPLWNLPFHFFRKVQWLKTETAEKCAVERPQVYQAIRMHVQQLQMLMMPAAPPAPGPGQPGGGPPDGSAIDAAVAGGAIKPAGSGKPDGSAIDQALAAGAIKPASPAQETRH